MRDHGLFTKNNNPFKTLKNAKDQNSRKILNFVIFVKYWKTSDTVQK